MSAYPAIADLREGDEIPFPGREAEVSEGHVGQYRLGSKLWLDEPESCRYAKHELETLKRRSPDCPMPGLLPLLRRRDMMMAEPSPRPDYKSDNFGQQAYAKKPRSAYRGF